jgi:hypothetical protein
LIIGIQRDSLLLRRVCCSFCPPRWRNGAGFLDHDLRVLARQSRRSRDTTNCGGGPRGFLCFALSLLGCCADACALFLPFPPFSPLGPEEIINKETLFKLRHRRWVEAFGTGKQLFSRCFCSLSPVRHLAFMCHIYTFLKTTVDGSGYPNSPLQGLMGDLTLGAWKLDPSGNGRLRPLWVRWPAPGSR